MRVAHRDDFDTHAVIGGKNIEEFAIAQTAAFFTVLSDTMYSNKPLAVVREVLCNAWDANIVAERRDRPVIVTIDEDKMSIKDAGFGIPHDLIHQIYCVYGNSTKENDGNQTGGFGLGSKSPFAYGDHFSVVNCHAGIKTVHAISKGSTLTNCKPDRRVMVSVPTTEEGVEVIIPVKTKEDADLFMTITQDIAAFGEMNVILNGKQIEMVPVSSAEGNMFLTNRKPRGVHSKLALRYGNVIYPIQPQEEYTGVYNELLKQIKSVPATSRREYDENDLILIMQAPPNSISVTPSRESLSNTETTINTLRGLMQGVMDYMKNSQKLFEQKLLDEHLKALDKLWENKKEDRVFFSENLLTDDFGTRPIKLSRGFEIIYINTLTALADHYLRYSVKIGTDMKRLLQAQKLDYQIDHDFRRKADLIRYRRITKGNFSGAITPMKAFRKTILRPLWRAIAAHRVKSTVTPSKLDLKLNRSTDREVSLLSVKNLFYATKPTRNVTRYTWTEATKFSPDHDKLFSQLQGVIIVTHSRLAYEEDWPTRVPEYRDTIPRDVPRMVYVAPRTKNHAAHAVELFEKLGYYVVDFAKIMEEYRAKNYVHVPKEMRIKAVDTKPRIKGLVLLSNNLKKDHKGKTVFNLNGHLKEGATRSENYEYILKPYDLSGRRGYNKQMFPWGNEHGETIASFFGSQIGMVVSDTQYESQKKKGKKDGLRFISEQIAQRVLTSASIRSYVENEKGELETRGHRLDIIVNILNYSSVLTKMFGLPPVSDETDLEYFRVYQMLERQLRYSGQPADDHYMRPIWDAKAVVDTWEGADFYKKLSATIDKSKGLHLLDLDAMLRKLKGLDKINPDYQVKVFIESSIINALKF